MANACKCTKTSHPTLATKELLAASRQCTIILFPFLQGIFAQNLTVILHPPYFSVSSTEDRTDTIKVIEAEMQAVLNTLTKHDFKHTFRNWQKRWERCIRAEGDYFEGDGGQ
jgi:hypothetical protein